MFKYFTYTNWAVHDRALLSVDLLNRNINRTDPHSLNLSRSVTIIQTYTIADIMWNDGTLEQNVISTSVLPLGHLGDHDFWPEDFVSYRNADKEEEQTQEEKENRTVGIIQSVNGKQRTAIVKWISSKEHFTEEVPVYDLKNHEDYEYRLGDVVLRMNVISQDVDITNDPTWAGEIIEMKDGDLTISWAGGQITTARFDQVVGADKVTGPDVNDEEEEEGAVVDANDMDQYIERFQSYFEDMNDGTAIRMDAPASERPTSENQENQNDGQHQHQDEIPIIDQADDNDDPESWETVSGDEDGNQDDVDEEDEEDEEDGDDDIETPLQNFIDRMVEGNTSQEQNTLIGYRRNAGEQNYIDSDDDEDQPNTSSTNEKLNQLQITSPPTPPPQQEEEQVQNPSLPVTSPPITTSQDPLGITKFQMVEDYSDHFFKDKQPNTTALFIRNVQREWKLLQSNLPENVFVFAFESRMDLMRAVIIGPKQTPYYNSVIVLDIHLPTEYPFVPPKVHFWSYGQRINPNLYSDGKICLSLLGTWSGRNEENWIPTKSNVLQVLVSVLGLVLVSEPYYNEAGYEKQVGTSEGHHNSVLYNENALLQCLWHSVKLIRNPPMHVQEIVNVHFERCGDLMRSRLEMYRSQDLELKGRYDDFGLMQLPPSVGFLKSLEKVLPKLSEIVKKE
ncbi:ubiquitin conjugating enzyme E2 [Acrasis kona]|uniref:Ubiquitin conjugating enzyme E2 n=1 Tax=Acrasis kona TaxID=1008807 RepID=A0AAW2YHQ8_9EUKA